MIFQLAPFSYWYYATGTYQKPDVVLLISLHPFVIKGYPANIKFMQSMFTSITWMEICPIRTVEMIATLGEENKFSETCYGIKWVCNLAKALIIKYSHVSSFYIINPAPWKKVSTTMRFSCASALSTLSAYISLCIWSLGLMDNTPHQVSILRSQMSEINRHCIS